MPDQSTEVNVVELWNKNIFSSLMKIQEYIRMARDGANSIEATFNISPRDVPVIQFNYLRQIATELDIVISNTKNKVKDTFYNNSMEAISSAEKLIDSHSDKILAYKRDDASRSKVYYVTPLFYEILTTLKGIREHLVDELSDILYGQSGDDTKEW